MRLISMVAAVAMASGAALSAAPAQADEGGRVLAGGIAGFVGGMLVGNALSQPHYAPPPPRYVYVDEDAPVYCHWVLSRPQFDEYEGVWRRHRVRVCD